VKNASERQALIAKRKVCLTIDLFPNSEDIPNSERDSRTLFFKQEFACL
jgi:hypothetical protein